MTAVGRSGLLLLAVALVVGCSSEPAAAPGGAPTPSRTMSSASTAVPSPVATPTVPAVDDPRFLAAQDRLEDSVVEVVQRRSRFSVWRQVCTGNKIRYAGRAYVVTAQHCVRGRTDLGVRVEGEVSAVARVESRRYPDVALLVVDGSGVLDSVEALDVGTGLPPGQEGAPAYAAGLPAAAGARLVTGVGEYLGRVQDPSDPDQLLDLVGLEERSPRKDACNYGASGSLGLVAPAYVLGPLAVRNNVTNKAGSNEDDDPVVDRGNRTEMAEQLGRSLAGFPTICGYAELTPKVLATLVVGR